MNSLKETPVGIVEVGDLGGSIVAACLQEALEQMGFQQPSESAGRKKATKTVDGTSYSAVYWWTTQAPGADDKSQSCAKQDAAYLCIKMECEGAQACSTKADELLNQLVTTVAAYMRNGYESLPSVEKRL